VEEKSRLPVRVNRLDHGAGSVVDLDPGMEFHQALAGSQLVRPALRDGLDQGPDPGLGDRVPRGAHGHRALGIESHRPRDPLAQTHVVGQDPAAMESLDVNGLPAAVRRLELEIDAHGVGPRFHLHDMPRRELAVESLSFHEGAGIIADSEVSRATFGDGLLGPGDRVHLLAGRGEGLAPSTPRRGDSRRRRLRDCEGRRARSPTGDPLHIQESWARRDPQGSPGHQRPCIPASRHLRREVGSTRSHPHAITSSRSMPGRLAWVSGYDVEVRESQATRSHAPG
jgi:hypothetical protein